MNQLEAALSRMGEHVQALRNLVHIKSDGTFVDGLHDNTDGLQFIADEICAIEEEMDRLFDVNGAYALLRQQFPAAAIGKLPKLMSCCSQAGGVCARHRKERCAGCGNYISTGHVHLDYVGHAAVTDRLLQVDPAWEWKPIRWTEDGQPAFDKHGGMWIQLTVLGVTRPAYGDGGGKRDADGVKMAISDAIKNGAMRFGVGLDLWSKEDLLAVNPPAAEEDAPKPSKAEPEGERKPVATREAWLAIPALVTDVDELTIQATACNADGQFVGEVKTAFLARKKELERHLAAVKDPVA